MKRTTTITISNTEYLLCYSTRVVRAVTQKFGSPESMSEVLNGTSVVDTVNAMLFMLHELIDAGARFCKLEGIDNPAPLTLQQLYSMFPIMKPKEVMASIKEAIALGCYISVHTKPKTTKGSKKPQMRKASIDSYVWHGLHIGLTYNETLDIPHGELLSLINEEQIQTGVADERVINDTEDPIPDWE